MGLLTRDRRGSIRRELDARREEFCRPLSTDRDDEEPFFCELGTLWCTEGHGDWETSWYREYRDGAKDDRPDL